MKNKFKFLTKMSLDRKIKTKWFLIANVILAIVIIEFVILIILLNSLVAILMKN